MAMQRRYVLPLLVCAFSSLLVLALSGAVPVDQVHHTFHILLPTIAFAVFAAYVALDVFKHGWPAFSWRLDA